MRRSILALTLAAVLSLALSGVAAAGQATQTLNISGPVMFFSILGGNSNGIANLSANVNGEELGSLKGTVNFALRDESLTISPSSSWTLKNDPLAITWSNWICDQFGCHFVTGTSMYERRHAEAPVDIRLGQLRGSGYLTINVFGGCIADCPPPGVFVIPPSSAANLLNAAVLSNKDAGTLQMFAVPVIQ